MLIFILHYFQEKLTSKFFQKSKKPYFGAILGPFYPNFGKNKFSWKKVRCQFLNISIIIVPSGFFFNHLLRAVPARSALFEKWYALFSTKNSKNIYHLGGAVF